MKEGTVLIAEDNRDDFYLLEQAFKRAEIKARLHWVLNGLDAKAYLEGASEYGDRSKHPLPDLALVDLKMPAMGGFELLQWIRMQPFLKRMPVVVLTSSERSPDINKAYDLGANSYLVKPSNLADLVQLVQSLRHYWLTLNRRPDFLHSETEEHHL